MPDTLFLLPDRVAAPSSDRAWATVSSDNLLLASDPAHHHKILRSDAQAAPVLAWSGWFADPLAPSHWPRDPQTWTKPGQAALDAALDRVLPAFNLTRPLLLRQHARHVLSDAPRSLNLLRARTNQPLGLILDPAAMLEPSMLIHAEDHYRRVLGALADHPAVAAIIVTGAREIAHDDGPAIVPTRLADSQVPAALIARLVHELAPPTLPRIVLPGDEPLMTEPR